MNNNYNNSALIGLMKNLGRAEKITFISSVQTLGAISRFYQMQWLIRTDGKIKSKESVLLTQLDDDKKKLYVKEDNLII